ncbi:hypothetical protein JCM16307_07520 [Thermococcus prieurii]
MRLAGHERIVHVMAPSDTEGFEMGGMLNLDDYSARWGSSMGGSRLDKGGIS